MAFAMDKTPGVGPLEYGHPSNHFELADLTATSSILTLGAAAKSFNWSVSLKVFTRGTGTTSPVFVLEGADNVGFTTNVRTLDTIVIGASATAQIGRGSSIQGRAPDGAKAFLRVRPIFSGTDTGTFDVMIDAA